MIIFAICLPSAVTRPTRIGWAISRTLLQLWWGLQRSFKGRNLLISYGNLFISCRAHARSRGATCSYWFIPFHVCLCFSNLFISVHTFSKLFPILFHKRFSNFLILFHTFWNSFLLFPRSFPGLRFSNSNVLFLYYFIVCRHTRSMGQKLGAARGAPKRYRGHLQVISWALLGGLKTRIFAEMYFGCPKSLQTLKHRWLCIKMRSPQASHPEKGGRRVKMSPSSRFFEVAPRRWDIENRQLKLINWCLHRSAESTF